MDEGLMPDAARALLRQWRSKPPYAMLIDRCFQQKSHERITKITSSSERESWHAIYGYKEPYPFNEEDGHLCDVLSSDSSDNSS